MTDRTMRVQTRGQAAPARAASPLLLFCAVSLGFAAAFAYLGDETGEPATTATDQHVLQRAADGTRGWSLAAVQAVTTLGTAPVIFVVALVVGVFLLRRKRRADLALLVGAVVGAALLSPWTKHLIHRARPTAFFRTAASGYSFPSGHTLNATCLALALAFILWRTPWRPAAKIAGSAALALYAGCVGASRVILGVHYLTDVLGGFLLGAAWVALLIALALAGERWQRTRGVTAAG